jgi:predicted phosphoribosyltransferase
VPVAPREITTNINQQADKVAVMHSQYLFSTVGQFYQDFSQASNSEVKEIMSKHGYITF